MDQTIPPPSATTDNEAREGDAVRETADYVQDDEQSQLRPLPPAPPLNRVENADS